VTAEEHVPARTVVAGAPARVRKTLGGRAAQWIAHSSIESRAQAQAYRCDNLGDPHQHQLKTASRGRRTTVIAGR
jgi:carbonic anhydrase/acetyltransferase-like protein (isoleucine patch superfamily)